MHLNLRKNKNKNKKNNNSKSTGRTQDNDTEYEDWKRRSKSYNMIFIGISLLIFGILGMVVVTQMDLQPGWQYSDFEGNYPLSPQVKQGPSLTYHGSSAPLDLVLCYTDLYSWQAWNNEYPLPNIGSLMLFNSKTGEQFGVPRPFDGPIKAAFPIDDMNGDGITDFFISKATVAPNWNFEGVNIDIDTLQINPRLEPIIDKDAYENKIVNGLTLTDINGVNYSNQTVIDVVSLSNFTDMEEDLIILGGKETEWEDEYTTTLTTHFINGTMVVNRTLGRFSYYEDIESIDIPKIELFKVNGTKQLLFVNRSKLVLYNLTSPNLNEVIYNQSSGGEWEKRFLNCKIIEDLNSDGNKEIILVNYTGNCTNQMILLDGSTGQQLSTFNVVVPLSESIEPEIEMTTVKEIGNIHNKKTYVLFESFGRIRIGNSGQFDIRFRFTTVYMISETSSRLCYVDFYITDSYISEERQTEVFNQDLNFDGVNEIVTVEDIPPATDLSPMQTYRVEIKDIFFGKVFSTMNMNFEVSSIKIINDINGDGLFDLLSSSSQSFEVISSQEPQAMFLSSAFPYGLGIPLFILLVSIIVIGIILLVYYGGKFRYSVEPIKENLKATAKKKKMTIFTIICSILIIAFSFYFFMILLNVFNSTLISGYFLTDIVVTNLIIMILWFGLLTLTAAIYNKYSPYFAYLFIKLRDMFFKVSRAYTNEFYVVDMKNRKRLGTYSKLKRVLVPLFLSLAIGLTAYNYGAPFFGYSTKFSTLSPSVFGSFIQGYMLLCILPLILSFIAFSFFNAGNYLLDDAGLVYFKEPKRYRKPADVEPVSIWAQSLVKGAAGFSALITFIEFALSMDVASMFGSSMANMTAIMAIVLIIFWGLPFLTGFAYILLAEELMDFSTDYNKSRLYKLMDKGDYDTTLREIKIEPSKTTESSEKASKNPNKNKK
jgi:hypothetical protein